VFLVTENTLLPMKDNLITTTECNRDEIVMSVGGIPDTEGHLLDIHETLYHSPLKGFYLHRVVTQIRNGDIWSVARLDENSDRPDDILSRLIEETQHLGKDEVIRYIVDIYMPGVDGLKERAHRALDLGGIESSGRPSLV